MRTAVLVFLLVSAVAACTGEVVSGSASGTGTGGSSTATDSVSSGPATGPGTSGATAAGSTGSALLCDAVTDMEACADNAPGNNQLCGWVQSFTASAEAAPNGVTCTYAETAGLCAQQLGDTGGTPFGSCGGDGTAPVYWRMDGDAVELVQTDGFWTPPGWSACDCHDGANDPDDPLECCCPCSGIWPPA